MIKWKALLGARKVSDANAALVEEQERLIRTPRVVPISAPLSLLERGKLLQLADRIANAVGDNSVMTTVDGARFTVAGPSHPLRTNLLPRSGQLIINTESAHLGSDFDTELTYHAPVKGAADNELALRHLRASAADVLFAFIDQTAQSANAATARSALLVLEQLGADTTGRLPAPNPRVDRILSDDHIYNEEVTIDELLEALTHVATCATANRRLIVEATTELTRTCSFIPEPLKSSIKLTAPDGRRYQLQSDGGFLQLGKWGAVDRVATDVLLSDAASSLVSQILTAVDSREIQQRVQNVRPILPPTNNRELSTSVDFDQGMQL